MFLVSFSDSLSNAKFKAKWKKNYFDNEIVRTRKILKTYGFSHYAQLVKSAITLLFNVASNLSYGRTAYNMQCVWRLRCHVCVTRGYGFQPHILYEYVVTFWCLIIREEQSEGAKHISTLLGRRYVIHDTWTSLTHAI